MSKNFEAIVLVALMALMALPLIVSSPQPILSSHPMVPSPSPPAMTASLVKSGGCNLPAAQCLTSINWSGYAVTGATGSVTFVGATWTVPTIAHAVGTSCSDPDFTWLDAAFWVGIDGFNNQFVEQTGTSADCVYGQVQYYPWYEFYPALSYPLPSTDVIYPGDVMYGYVSYTSPNFHIWLQDMTAAHAWTFSLYGTNAGAPRTSAEWITEAAYGCITPTCSLGNFLALTDFTSVTFTGASATVSGHTYPVSSSAWGTSIYWLAVTNVFYPPPGPFLRAYPTAAKSGGFTIKWVSSGP